MQKVEAMLQEAGLEGIRLERAQVDPAARRVLARFASDRLPTRQVEEQIARALRQRFVQCGVQVSLCAPSLKEDFLSNPQTYAEELTARIVEEAPGAAAFLRDAEWACGEGVVVIRTQGEAGASYLNERGVAQMAARLIKSLVRAEVEVRAEWGGNQTQEDEEEQLRREREMIRKIVEDQKAAEENRQKRAQYEERQIFGTKASGKITPIGELRDDSGTVAIEGKVLTVETRMLKGDERMMLAFGVTDYTGSIKVKVFMAAGDKKKAELVKEGGGVRVRGECALDNFSKEIGIVAKDVALVPLDERTDDEEEKRVELHLHTQMSTMDGVSSVGDLMRRAAAFGHEAVAITDHGVVQGFPEAFDTARALAKGETPIKFIPGMEGYLVDDAASIVRGAEGPLDCPVVVLDVETTGLSSQNDALTEIGAVRVVDGEIVDSFSMFVDPSRVIPEKVVKLTGITDDMVRGAPKPAEAIAGLIDFIGDDLIAAHNASFDAGFLEAAAKAAGLHFTEKVLDTLALSRALLPNIKNHKLDTVCKTLGVPLKNHHRAAQDAGATALALVKLLRMAGEQGIDTLEGLNTQLGLDVAAQNNSFHIILLAHNAQGLFNLYKLVSLSHLHHFYRRPRLPRSQIEKYREGLIIGSACESGELFKAILAGKPQREIDAIAKFYDYLEIQPIGNNAFLVREGAVKDDEGLRALNRKIVELGDRLGIPVCATCDVHFLDPQDAVFREILMSNKHFDDAAFQAPLYLRTTREMLDEFAYLGEEKAREVVVANPRAIAARVEKINMFPKHPRDETTFQPTLPDAERLVEESTWNTAREIYGDALPEIVEKRITKELGSILGNGFGTLYHSARLLVQKSISDGYLVGSRGSVGSSLVATLIGITEVNPLPPHYVCPACKHSDFDVDSQAYPCGPDLPEKLCPVCGAPLGRAGYDIPFEVFLGFEGDKVPDIDLNFSGVYQGQAQEYVKTIFGQGNVYKAGTIGTLAEKKAFGEVRGFLENKGAFATTVERDRLIRGITGVKQTSGQHPGGMVVVPAEYDIHSFSPTQHPADKKESGIITTHFDFGSLHDILVKLDILGHDDPTMIHMMEELTGVNARGIPLTDPKVMSLFTSTEALGVTPEQIGSNTGTLGIPEFGTGFVRGMLEETKPTTMAELLRISGLSHGTNVWLNNAQDMIRDGLATLGECFCTRDDIMNTLIAYGVETKLAFTIMEIVRKGRGKSALTKEMESAMRDAGVAQHYIDSCYKIEYMFPKAHAAAYVMMALRVAYYKVYHPLAYYASYFTVRADEFDSAMMLAPPEELRQKIEEFRKNDEDSAKNERLITLLEIVIEMRERGLGFLPLDIEKSHSADFLIEDGAIRPPFNSLPGVGLAAAEAIVEARGSGNFMSVEDMQVRSKISKVVVEALRQQGCFREIPTSDQMSLF